MVKKREAKPDPHAGKFRCKICKKWKNDTEYGMRHLGEDMCLDCMNRGEW